MCRHCRHDARSHAPPTICMARASVECNNFCGILINDS
jgi:hypothetical protein